MQYTYFYERDSGWSFLWKSKGCDISAHFRVCTANKQENKKKFNRLATTVMESDNKQPTQNPAKSPPKKKMKKVLSSRAHLATQLSDQRKLESVSPFLISGGTMVASGDQKRPHMAFFSDQMDKLKFQADYRREQQAAHSSSLYCPRCPHWEGISECYIFGP